VAWQFRFDIAVARLESAVPPERAQPFPFGDDAAIGEQLFLMSWRKGEGSYPRQRSCPVIDGLNGLVTLGCRVEGGESGSPLLRKTEAGLELVAILSSRSTVLEQPVALASNVRLRLGPILDLLNEIP